MVDWIVLLTSLLENNKQQSKDNSICYDEEENLSAYQLYGNFSEKFLSDGTGIFLALKTGIVLSCTIYKIPVNFSLFLDLNSGTSNPNKWYRKFCLFQ